MSRNENAAKPRGSQEAKLQAKCFKWFWNTYPKERRTFYHVQNKAKNAIEGNKFKAMGVIKGIADMPWHTPSGKVCYFEFKTDTGTQSDEQKEFEARVKLRGGEYVIIRNFEEFQKEVNLRVAVF